MSTHYGLQMRPRPISNSTTLSHWENWRFSCWVKNDQKYIQSSRSFYLANFLHSQDKMNRKFEYISGLVILYPTRKYYKKSFDAPLNFLIQNIIQQEFQKYVCCCPLYPIIADILTVFKSKRKQCTNKSLVSFKYKYLLAVQCSQPS